MPILSWLFLQISLVQRYNFFLKLTIKFKKLRAWKYHRKFFIKICKSVTCGLSGWKTSCCELTDRVAEWQIFGKMSQKCSFFGLFSIQTHPFCCQWPHGRPLCSSWETIVFYAVDHRFPRRKPSVSRVETTVFRRRNRWIPLNRLMVSALNWRSRSLSSDQSMRPWPLRKKLEKRCFYVCRAPNLSLCHQIGLTDWCRVC